MLKMPTYQLRSCTLEQVQHGEACLCTLNEENCIKKTVGEESSEYTPDMDQFDEIVKLIKSIEEYIRLGKMNCNEVPIEDLLMFISAEYSMMRLYEYTAVDDYRLLLEDRAGNNDREGLSAVIRCIINDNAIISQLYDERTKRLDLESDKIPYKVEMSYYRNLEKNQRVHFVNKSHTYNRRFKGRGAVYSAVTGGYDTIRDPEVINENLDYYLFTDNDSISSDIWKVVKIDNPENLDKIRLARKIKILGIYELLEDYDYSVWVDGKILIKGDILEYIEEYSLGEPIICFNHYCSDDIYQEAENCLVLNKDDNNLINMQVDRYKAEGYPVNSGLIDSCVLIRDHHDELLKKTMYDWWGEVKNGSFRDQLSFNYVCWKNGLLYDTSPLVVSDNRYCKTYVHVADIEANAQNGK